MSHWRNISTARAGYTLMEMMVGSAVLVLTLAAAFTLMANMLRMQQRLQIKGSLDGDLEKSIEYIRRDVRLTSTGIGLLAWFPADAIEYTAVSMPLGGDQDNDGTIDRNPDGSIKWYTTVIYHVAPGTPDKLRRTTFTPRNNDVTPDDYYKQLEGVVNSSDPSQYEKFEFEGETVASTIIFKNLVKMFFRPPAALFDGYAPTEGKKRFNFGAVLLNGGDRYLQLHVADRNPNSSGYKVIVDRVSAGSSGTPREAELFVPTYKHPAYPHYYMSTSPGELSGLRNPLWYGDAAISYVPQSRPGKLSFHLYNDIWCDTNFNEPPGEETRDTSAKLDRGFAASYPYLFDNVVTMDKGTAWTASSAGDLSTTNTFTTHTSVTVPMYGSEALKPYTIVRNGRWVRLHFERAPGMEMKIDNVRIHDAASGNSEAATFNGGSGSVRLTTSDSLTVATDWVEEWKIDSTNTYTLSFDIEGTPTTPSGVHVWHNGGTTNIATVHGAPSSLIPAFTSMETGYPDTAIYRSRPFDTQTDTPRYRYLSWTHDEFFSDGGDIDMRVRAGDNPDMSDAHWTDANSGSDGYFQSNNRNVISGLPRGRYVQYEALFTCGRGGAMPDAHIATTPILRDVSIEWRGDRTLTDVVVDFGTGPDCGIVRATVDGVDLVRALEVDIEIYRDSVTKRETATGKFEIRPLNSGL